MLKRLLVLFFFAVCLTAFPHEVFLWKYKGFSYLLSHEDGETPREALARYLDGVKEIPELKTLTTGLPTSMKGVIEPFAFDNRKLVLITENDSLVHDDLVRAFEMKGARVILRPMAVELTQDKEEALEYKKWVSEHVGRVQIPGGDDIAPEFYGEAVAGAKGFNATRDRGEIDFLKYYIQNSQGYVSGFCRGHQLLGVIFGLTLIQDLPTEVGVHNHKKGMHPVEWVSSGGNPLKTWLNLAGPFETNTLHHQAIDPKSISANSYLQPLLVSGKGKQSVIEAMASKDGRIVTVQFHPELMMKEHVGRAIVSGLIEQTPSSATFTNSRFGTSRKNARSSCLTATVRVATR